MTDKKELIERIQRTNPTATTGFLLSFSVNQLQEYLDHLEAVYGQSREPAQTRAPATVNTW